MHYYNRQVLPYVSRYCAADGGPQACTGAWRCAFRVPLDASSAVPAALYDSAVPDAFCGKRRYASTRRAFATQELHDTIAHAVTQSCMRTKMYTTYATLLALMRVEKTTA